MNIKLKIKQLDQNDLNLINSLHDCFSNEFNDPQSDQINKPSSEYMRGLLRNDTFISIVAKDNQKLIGGLVAYELKQFTQEGSEIYVYEIAVAKEYRRKGVATALVSHLRAIAKDRDACVILAQADYVDESVDQPHSSQQIQEEEIFFGISEIDKKEQQIH